ncbi:hypothetical protein Tco_1080539 [Tanacetum coccineum]|uniref:Uncharacterized protein n=1 Tax=Tanacetum coccineum TaxID=301880 RepID=A0ABQ5HW88_9ASTR
MDSLSNSPLLINHSSSFQTRRMNHLRMASETGGRGDYAQLKDCCFEEENPEVRERKEYQDYRSHVSSRVTTRRAKSSSSKDERKKLIGVHDIYSSIDKDSTRGIDREKTSCGGSLESWDDEHSSLGEGMLGLKDVMDSLEVRCLLREVGIKQYEINTLKTEFEKLKQEKDAIDFKIEKFDKASKDLDQLLESQITGKSKKGLGYSAVPPPHPLIYNRPNKLDLSYSGLEEFQQPEFEGYGLRANKSVCENSSNETKKNSDAPLIEEWVSNNEDEVESPVVVKKKIIFPTAAKIEFVKPKQHEKPVGKPVKYAEIYKSQRPRGNQRNWNNEKSQ